jgi:hypothetical protein
MGFVYGKPSTAAAAEPWSHSNAAGSLMRISTTKNMLTVDVSAARFSLQLVLPDGRLVAQWNGNGKSRFALPCKSVASTLVIVRLTTENVVEARTVVVR